MMTKRKKKSPNSFIEETFWAVKLRNFGLPDQPWYWSEFSPRMRRLDAIKAFCEHNGMTNDEWKEIQKRGLAACKKFQFVELP